MSDSAAAKAIPVRDPGAGASPEGRPALARIRVLPNGEFRNAELLKVEGSALRVDIPGPPLAPGALLEIECGNALYLGEVERRSGTAHRVIVEHFVDRASLGAVRDMWS